MHKGFGNDEESLSVLLSSRRDFRFVVVAAVFCFVVVVSVPGDDDLCLCNVFSSYVITHGEQP